MYFTVLYCNHRYDCNCNEQNAFFEQMTQTAAAAGKWYNKNHLYKKKDEWSIGAVKVCVIDV